MPRLETFRCDARLQVFGTCQATVLWAFQGNVPGEVPGNVRHFGWLHPPVPAAVVGRNRWCRLPAGKPSVAAAFCRKGALGGSLWHVPLRHQPVLGSLQSRAACKLQPRESASGTCQATVLWAPEGNVARPLLVPAGNPAQTLGSYTLATPA